MHREQSTERHDLRMSCLRGARLRVDALTELFVTADDRVVRNAADAVLALPDIATCANDELLQRTLPPPADPEDRAEIDAIELELAAIEAALDTGVCSVEADRAEALVSRARALGDAPTLGRTLVAHGACQRQVGEHEAALERLTEGYWLAIDGGDDATAMDAAMELIEHLSRSLSDPARAESWARTAETLVRRTGRNGEIRARLELALARIDLARGDYASARSRLEAALNRERTRTPRLQPVGIEIAQHLAHAAGMQSRADEGIIEVLEEASAAAEAHWGPQHPRTATIIGTLAGMHLRRGDSQRARDGYRRAYEIVAAAFDPDDFRLAPFLYNLSTVEAQLGDEDEALALVHEAIELQRAAYGPRDIKVGRALNGLASTLNDMDRPAEAERAGREALQIIELHTGPANEDAARARANTAIALALQGDLGEASELMRSAVAICRELDSQHAMLPWLLFHLSNIQGERGEHTAALHSVEEGLAVAEATEATPALKVALDFERALARWHIGRDRDDALARMREAQTAMAALPTAQEHLAELEDKMEAIGLNP